MLTKSQSPYWAIETLEQTSPPPSSDTSGFKQQHVQKEQTTRKPTPYIRQNVISLSKTPGLNIFPF